MYKCNLCGAVFDSPAEQKREVEYYLRPFGNGSEPYGGGYYDCCPCCLEEDFEEYEEEDIDGYEADLEKLKKIEMNLKEHNKMLLEHKEQVDVIVQIYADKCKKIQNQLSLTEKALELAVKHLEDYNHNCFYCRYNLKDKCPEKCPNAKKEILNYLKTKSKEIIKNG
jgi:hypothetical protein